MPTPNPLLDSLEPMIGTWELFGRTEGATEDNVKGKATIKRLEGGFFYQQDVEIDFAGMIQVRGMELIGYEAETNSLASQVYSNVSPVAVPYHWKMDGNDLTIHMDAGATMKATMSDDGKSFAGAWAPDPGHESDPGNVSYSFNGRKIAD
jgi:hypothetical protein